MFRKLKVMSALCAFVFLGLGVSNVFAEPIRPVDAELLKHLKDPSSVNAKPVGKDVKANADGAAGAGQGDNSGALLVASNSDPEHATRAEPTLAPTHARTIQKNRSKERPKKAQVGVQLSSFKAMGLLVLALMALVFGGLYLKNRLRQRKDAKDVGRLMSLKETLWLGKGQRILLVNVAGRDVLLSVTHNGIQTLVTFTDDAVAGPVTDEKSAARPEDFFPSMVEEEMAAPVVERQAPERAKVPSNERVKQILRRLNTL